MSESPGLSPVTGGQESYGVDSSNNTVVNQSRSRSITLHGPSGDIGKKLTEVSHESPEGVEFFNEHTHQEVEQHGSILSRKNSKGEEASRKFSLESGEGAVEANEEMPVEETIIMESGVIFEDTPTEDEEIPVKKEATGSEEITITRGVGVGQEQAKTSSIRKIINAAKNFFSRSKPELEREKTVSGANQNNKLLAKVAVSLLTVESRTVNFDDRFFKGSEDDIIGKGGRCLTKNISGDPNNYEGIVLDKAGRLHFLYDPSNISKDNIPGTEKSTYSFSYTKTDEVGNKTTVRPHDQLQEALSELAKLDIKPNGIVAYKGLVETNDTMESRGNAAICNHWIKEYLTQVDQKSYDKLRKDTQKVYAKFYNCEVSKKSTPFENKTRDEISKMGGRCLVDLDKGSSFEGVVLDKNNKLHFIIDLKKLEGSGIGFKYMDKDENGNSVESFKTVEDLCNDAMRALIKEGVVPKGISMVRTEESKREVYNGKFINDPLYLTLTGIFDSKKTGK